MENLMKYCGAKITRPFTINEHLFEFNGRVQATYVPKAATCDYDKNYIKEIRILSDRYVIILSDNWQIDTYQPSSDDEDNTWNGDWVPVTYVSADPQYEALAAITCWQDAELEEMLKKITQIAE